MKNKMIKISTKISTALVVAASVMTMASITAFAADDTVIADETVAIEEMAATEEAPECEMTVPETEGQGDIIDDEFAYVEGQGDVIDDEFAYVEGQGDVIDDCFAVAPEDAQPVEETVVETPAAETEATPEVEGQGDVIDDQFAVSEEEAWEAANEIRTAEMAKCFGEFGTVEMNLHNAEWYQEYQKAQEAKAAEEARLEAEAAVEAVEVAENDTEVVAPSVKSFVAVGSADEAQKAEETKKDDDDLVFTFNPFNPIVPVRAVPSRNQSENKSDALKTVQTINKFINPSDSVYGNPIRELIDNSDVLGADEKEYLKNSTSLMIGADEGMACADFLPLWGSLKKVGKMSESLVKLHDSKTTADQINNTIDVVQNIAEGVVCAIPGGGLALNAYKAQMEFGSYCFKKVCRFVNWLF